MLKENYSFTLNTLLSLSIILMDRENNFTIILLISFNASLPRASSWLNLYCGSGFKKDLLLWNQHGKFIPDVIPLTSCFY